MPVTAYIKTGNQHFENTLKSYITTSNFVLSLDMKSTDFAILDTGLTNPTAYEICQDLRRANPKVSIIILSNETTLGEDVKAQYAGANKVFTVPFEPQKLIEFMRKGILHGEY